MTPDARHRCRESAQAMLACETVETADVYEDADGPYLEATVWGARVRSPVLQALANHGLDLDPNWTKTRGDPTHTHVLARP